MKNQITLALGLIICSTASVADLRSAVQNPISSLVSLPFKFTFDYGANNGDGTIMNINPVVPVTVGEWNLVNRALIPVGSVDGPITGPGNPSPSGAGSASGLGDTRCTSHQSSMTRLSGVLAQASICQRQMKISLAVANGARVLPVWL